ncbi:hypothetical protein CsSME_00044350 [Camellia sinensis var. sinensis]
MVVVSSSASASASSRKVLPLLLKPILTSHSFIFSSVTLLFTVKNPS